MSVARPTDELGYFHARAVEEQVAAQRATSAAARDRHDELAMMYRFREALLKNCTRLSFEEPVPA